MTLLQKVKLALRINHSSLDSDIEDTISIARAEMIRSGVAESVANSDHELIEMAIKTYCLYVYRNDDGYLESWQYQLDNLRKSTLE